MSSGMASMTMSGCQKPKQYSMALPQLHPRSCCNQQGREQGHWAIGTKQRWNRSGKLHIQYVIADTPLPTSPRFDGPSHKAEQGEMVGATKPVDNGQWPWWSSIFPNLCRWKHVSIQGTTGEMWLKKMCWNWPRRQNCQRKTKTAKYVQQEYESDTGFGKPILYNIIYNYTIEESKNLFDEQCPIQDTVFTALGIVGRCGHSDANDLPGLGISQKRYWLCSQIIVLQTWS